MECVQVCFLGDICSPPPFSPSADPSISSSAEGTSYAPSNFTGLLPDMISRHSQTGGSSLIGSPGSSWACAMPSGAKSHRPTAPEIDYGALLDHLPALRSEFQGSSTALQALQEVVEFVVQGMQPTDSIINRLVLRDVDEYRCSVSTCDRHIKGNGWTRLDRARGHFRTEHLGNHFPCRALGCDVRCRRLSDLLEHEKSHLQRPLRFYCDYCHRSYVKRSNLNRHIELGHRMRAPRRIRQTTRR